MQKILLAAGAIILFTLVVVFTVNDAQQTTQNVVSMPRHTSTTQQAASLTMLKNVQGDAYVCDADINLYVLVRATAADVTLVYPDDQYGTSALHREESDDQNVKELFVNDEENNVLTFFDDETLTFTVNDVMIADNCVSRT